MKTLHDMDIYDIAEMAVEEAKDGKTACAALYYDHACALVKELLGYDSVRIASVELESPEFDNYDDEYLVTVCDDDGDNIDVYCEKLKTGGEKGYLQFDADLLLLESDAHYAITESNCQPGAITYEVELDEDEDGPDDFEEEEDEEEVDEEEVGFDGKLRICLKDSGGKALCDDLTLQQFCEMLFLASII